MTTVATPASRFSLKALLQGRCPRCRQGRIFPPFLSPRLLAMNVSCDNCGLRFEREAGYFLGAMYFSYTLQVLTVLPVSLALIFLTESPLWLMLAVLVVQTLVSTPVFYRVSRVAWIHVDQAFIPSETKRR